MDTYSAARNSATLTVNPSTPPKKPSVPDASRQPTPKTAQSGGLTKQAVMNAATKNPPVSDGKGKQKAPSLISISDSEAANKGENSAPTFLSEQRLVEIFGQTKFSNDKDSILYFKGLSDGQLDLVLKSLASSLRLVELSLFSSKDALRVVKAYNTIGFAVALQIVCDYDDTADSAERNK